MKTRIKLIISGILIAMSFSFYSQTQEIKLNPEKVKLFFPYVHFKHGGAQGFEAWKQNNKMLYIQEMWYYSESFYVKRNHLNEGYTLNEEIIDVSRFESKRKPNEEVIIPIDGFKDAIVLIPAKLLIYKPL